MNSMDRRAFLKKAGLGTVAAASLPALFNTPEAFAGASNGRRMYVFVSFSQAPAQPDGVLPRIGMQGAGTFKPDAHYVKGGGTFVLFDQNSPVPKTLIASGRWEPTRFVSYDTKGLGHYGVIQPGILTMLADLEGVASGATLGLVCNVGPAGLLTGEEEGWTLTGTPYGEFEPLDPPLGITHLSVEGVSVDCGA